MFRKKSEQTTKEDVPAATDAPPAMPEIPHPVTRSRDAALLGSTLRIRGDIEGAEDVLVQGHVEGTVTLQGHRLTIGEEGDVNATVNAGTVIIDGRVQGDLQASDQVVVHQSGKMLGNIRAPRVVLEDGCKFKGTIDMDVEPVTKSLGKVTDFKSVANRIEDEAGHKAV